MILGYSMLDLQYFLLKIRDFIMPLYRGKTFVKEWFLLSVNDDHLLQVYNFMNAKAWPDWWGNKILSANIGDFLLFCIRIWWECHSVDLSPNTEPRVNSDGGNSNASKSWKSTFFLGVLTTGCWPGDYGTETWDWPWRGQTVNGSALVMGRDQNPRHVLIIRTEIWRRHSNTRLQNHKT